MDFAKKLVNLITANPDLPVIPLVCSDVVPDDIYGHYMGAIGNSEVEFCGFSGDHFCVGEDDFKEQVYSDCEEDFWKMTDDEVEKELDRLFRECCKEVIVVYITPGNLLDFKEVKVCRK